jgi:hypothetical protein
MATNELKSKAMTLGNRLAPQYEDRRTRHEPGAPRGFTRAYQDLSVII